RIWGLPPWMVGAKTGDSLVYSTVAEQGRAYVMFCLRPTLIAVEQALALDVDLFPPEQRLYPQFELDALLRAAPSERSAFYTAAPPPGGGGRRREGGGRPDARPADPAREEVPTNA